MHCESCGAELAQNALFCGHCGTAVSQPTQYTEEYQTQYADQFNAEQMNAQPTYEQPNTNQQDTSQQGGYDFVYQGNPQQTYGGNGFYNYQTTVVGFGEAIKRYFTHYADFNGRASRTEFWWAVLFEVLVGTLSICIPILNLIVWAGMLVPCLAIRIRRLHDIGMSGTLMLLVFVPGIGSIALIVLWCLQSAADNQWGSSVRIE